MLPDESIIKKEIGYHQRKISEEFKMLERSRVTSRELQEESIESIILLGAFCMNEFIQSSLRYRS